MAVANSTREMARSGSFPVGGSAPRIVIVGSGVGGIAMGIALRKRGVRDFMILEKASSLGGTWRDNRYPGLACDVPAHVYSYSFRPNPGWTSDFAKGPEILRYFDRVAHEYGVKSHIRFNQEVISAVWKENHWAIRTAAGLDLEADIVIFACGRLHHPNIPDIQGLQDFRGEKFHSARWPTGLALKGKRVGIIGTGSTATQLISALAKDVGRLSVFQRTPQWVVSWPNPKIGWWRRLKYRLFPHTLRRHVAERRAHIESIAGNIAHGRKKDVLRESTASALALIQDPVLREKLTPTFEPGCKRLVISGEFHAAIQKSNVDLVTAPIDRVVASGVQTGDGILHPLDVLVFATGFKTDWYMRPVTIAGRDGVTLDELWKDGPLNYKSVALPDMPNLFVINGPYSPGGSASIVDIIEVHVGYIGQLIDHIAVTGAALSPKRDVSEDLLEEIRERGSRTVWATGGCKSWYLDKDGIPLYNPLTIIELREQMAAPDFSHFDESPLANARIRA